LVLKSDPGFRNNLRTGSVKFFHIGSLQKHCCLKSQDRFAEGPDPDPLVRGMDPRIRIRIHPKMSWIRNTVDKVYFLFFSSFFLLSGSDPGFRNNPRAGSVKFFHIGSLQQHCCLKSQDRFAEGEAALAGRHGRRAGQAAQALQAGGGRLERDDGEALDVRRVH
jgi:hypothetical protein